MINLRQATDLRAIRPDVSFAVPKVGIGLQFYTNTETTIKLYSNNISGKCFVPVTNGSGDNLTLEFTPDAETGMTLDIGGTGAGRLDEGTLAVNTFYDVRVISKRGTDAALLAHLSGRQEPNSWYMMSSVSTTGNPTTINVAGAHSIQSGESVTIYDSDISALNGTHTATRTGDTTFTIPVENTGSSDPGEDAVFSGGGFTLPSGYTHYSDVVFGISCTADWAGGTTYDDIQPFINPSPGVCKYQTGGDGYIGSGIQVLSSGTVATVTTPIDLAKAAPRLLANTSYESRGSVLLRAKAQNTSTSAIIDATLYYSSDGRADDDGGPNDALETLYTFFGVSKLDGGGRYSVADNIILPNMVSRTTDGSGATGTISNVLQYRWSSTGSTRAFDVWVTGFDLNG